MSTSLFCFPRTARVLVLLLFFAASHGLALVAQVGADSDKDGLPDGWEAANKLNANLSSDAHGDPDGDGYDNFEEYVLGQNPHVADPARAAVTVSVSDSVISEPGTDVGRFRVTRSANSSQALKVYYTLRGTARNGKDYQPTTNEVTIPANQTWATVTIAPTDDSDYEGTETVTLALAPDLRYLYGATTEATINLLDNDRPVVSVFATDPSAAEAGFEPGEFTFERTGSKAAALTVFFTLAGASNGTDYNTVPTSVAFPADESVVTFAVTPRQDTAYEGNELVTLTLSANAEYQVAPNTPDAIVTIADDDLPVVTVTGTDSDARESGLNPGRFTFNRTGVTLEALAVEYRIGGTATNGTDYAALSGLVTISAGAASAIVDVVTLDDAIEEKMETVVVTIKGADHYDLGSPWSATVYLDDKNPTRFTWEHIKPTAVYSTAPAIDSPSVVEITRLGSSRLATNLGFYVSTNTPTGPQLVPPAHYRISGNVSGTNVVFATNASKAVVRLTGLASAVGSLHLAVPAVAHPLIDTKQIDLRPATEFLKVDLIGRIAIEGVSTSKVTIRLSRLAAAEPLRATVSVGGLAKPGLDHNLSSNVDLTIRAGELSAQVDLVPKQDGLPEGWEMVVVSINPRTHTVASPWTRFAFIREAAADVNKLSETDYDADGLPDRFEVRYSLDPLTLDDISLDSDGDGLSVFEEWMFNTNPNDTNTNKSGVNDHRYARSAHLPRGETIDVKLVIRGEGFSPVLLFGNIRHASPKFGEVFEGDYRLPKGHAYPVSMVELIQNRPLGPTTPGNPRYSAQILSVTSLQEFFLNDPSGLLGTGRVWNVTR